MRRATLRNRRRGASQGPLAALKSLGQGALAAVGRKGGRRRRVERAAPARIEETPSPRRASPRGFIWVWGLAVGLATASFVLHLRIRFDVIQAGYALSQAQAEQRRLRLEQRELRLELATLKAPDRIERQAREELGMVRPDYDHIVRLDGRGTRVALRRE